MCPLIALRVKRGTVENAAGAAAGNCNFGGNDLTDAWLRWEAERVD
jgi:hypothetical protein